MKLPFPELAEKYAAEPKPKRTGEPNWTILSSHLLGHVFFNIFGEKVAKKNQVEGKLPSMDAKAVAKFKSPGATALATAITEYRSKSRQHSSFENALTQLYEIPNQKNFAKGFINLKGIEQDNVERIFTRAEESIPLNMDKVARNAFKATSEETLDLREFIGADPANITQLPYDELAQYLGPDILTHWAGQLAADEERTNKDIITKALQISEDLPKINAILMDLLSQPHSPNILIPARMWISFDWSQAELYLIALLSQSASLIQALTSDDFHNTVAGWTLQGPSTFTGTTVPPEFREIAKTLTFAFVYSTFDVKVAAAIVRAKLPNLDPELLALAIERYAERVPDLMAWVDRHIQRWGDLEHNPTSTFNYAFGAAKYIERPEYLVGVNLGSSKQGRVATNTMGQNSVGHLLKVVLAGMRKDPTLQHKGTAEVSTMIPLFDALYFTAKTTELAKTVNALSEHINCTLVLDPHFDGAMRDTVEDSFAVTMKTDIKVSLQAWGTVSKRITSGTFKSEKRHYI